jgi:hypothetical protein
MKCKTTAALGLVAALMASGASAQGLAEGLEVEGFIDLSGIYANGNSELFLSGDVTVGTRFGGGPFGVALGIEAYATDGDSVSALYPMLTYSTDFGDFTIGRPRFVLDTLVDVPPLAGAAVLGTEEIALGTRSFAGISVLLSDPGDLNFAGLRYDGDYGDLRVSAAYHRLWDTGTDANVYSIGLGYRIGATELVAGVETLRDGPDDLTNFIIGATYDEGPLSAGLLYSGVELGPDNINVLSLWTGYEVIDGLTVTGSYRGFIDDDARIFGLDAEYVYASGAYTGVGVGVQDLGGGSDEFFVFDIGLRF